MSELTRLFFLCQLASTLAMVGLIWFVQIVHYPLFAKVGEEQFVSYETSHTNLTGFVVIPFMLTELATAILMFWYRPGNISVTPILLGIGLVALIWLTTFTMQVPLHTKLSQQFDLALQQKLVLGNWIRTIAWSARGGLLLWMLSRVL